MAFESEAIRLARDLIKMGATVEDSPNFRNYLLVNNKYDICYTNFYYRLAEDSKTLGQGRSEFLKLIQNEMNGFK